MNSWLHGIQLDRDPNGPRGPRAAQGTGKSATLGSLQYRISLVQLSAKTLLRLFLVAKYRIKYWQVIFDGY